MGKIPRKRVKKDGVLEGVERIRRERRKGKRFAKTHVSECVSEYVSEYVSEQYYGFII